MIVGFLSEKDTRAFDEEVVNMHAIADVPSCSALSLLGLLLRPRDRRRGLFVPSPATSATSRCGNKHWSPSLQVPSFFQNQHVWLCLNSHLSPLVHVPWAHILQACCPFPLPFGDFDRFPFPFPLSFGDFERPPLPLCSLSWEYGHELPFGQFPLENHDLQTPFGHLDGDLSLPLPELFAAMARPLRVRLFCNSSRVLSRLTCSSLLRTMEMRNW